MLRTFMYKKSYLMLLILNILLELLLVGDDVDGGGVICIQNPNGFQRADGLVNIHLDLIHSHVPRCRFFFCSASASVFFS